MEQNWYVIHTYSGYENKVKANLERRVESMGMEDKIFRILVPTEEEFEIRDGKRKITKKKVFPGYVLVEMILTDDSWYVVRNTPGVTGFVGSGSKPVPLREEEVKMILHQMGYEEPKVKLDFEVGEAVKVIRGPFENFSGVIEDINPEKGKIKVIVTNLSYKNDFIKYEIIGDIDDINIKSKDEIYRDQDYLYVHQDNEVKLVKLLNEANVAYKRFSGYSKIALIKYDSTKEITHFFVETSQVKEKLRELHYKYVLKG